MATVVNLLKASSLLSSLTAHPLAFTIIVQNVTFLGPQLNPDVTNVSRDGGYSVLINGRIVWLYDDTECMDSEGNQLSFVSNTAAYQAGDAGNDDISSVNNFGLASLGADKNGRSRMTILPNTDVGKGGWIPFQTDELRFNAQMKGKERVAIWPGTNPTPISTTQAFLYAPLVYVDYHPQDPAKEYQPRGMTLITVTAPNSGPVALRQGNLIIPGTQVAFGGFSALLGYKSTEPTPRSANGDRDVYLIGMTSAGLQLARVDINDMKTFSRYTFWDPKTQNFSMSAPKPTVTDISQIYLPGSFSSGSVFYSPYFKTFIMVYFNKMTDSTFFIRYLQLDQPLNKDSTWIARGKKGKGIRAEDTEALVKYSWSTQQKLYASPTGPGGFNYAGTAHPEFFNTQYYARTLYPDGTSRGKRFNDWFGSVDQSSASADGKHLLLSWTSQVRLYPENDA